MKATPSDPCNDEACWSTASADTTRTTATSPSSPTGIPSWLWLPILTLLLGFICWLSLRSFLQYLPIRVQYALQGFADRAGYRGIIRLNEDDEDDEEEVDINSEYSRTQDGASGINISDDDDEADGATLRGGDLGDDYDDDDDELPLAYAIPSHMKKKRRRSDRSSFSTFRETKSVTDGSKKRTKKPLDVDRLVQMFSGKAARARGRSADRERERIGNGFEMNSEHVDEERIIELPVHHRSNNADSESSRHQNHHSHPLGSNQSDTSDNPSMHSTTSADVFRSYSNSETDAFNLPNHFRLPPVLPAFATNRHNGGSASGTSSPGREGRPVTYRSPSMSRTSSLVAIEEEPVSAQQHISTPLAESDPLQASSLASSAIATSNSDQRYTAPTKGLSRRSSERTESSEGDDDSVQPDWVSAVSGRTSS